MPTMLASILAIGWCPGEDSNLHTLRHMDLNHARLPIPPPGHASLPYLNSDNEDAGLCTFFYRAASRCDRMLAQRANVRFALSKNVPFRGRLAGRSDDHDERARDRSVKGAGTGSGWAADAKTKPPIRFRIGGLRIHGAQERTRTSTPCGTWT
jgi:hypothetical protein